MNIKQNTESEDLFYDRLRKHLADKDRVYKPNTFHVSDILSPRKWLWKQLKPLPTPRSDIGFFLAGQAHHLIAEIIIAGEDGRKEADLCLTKDGLTVVGHPDVLHDYPTEFKTSRKWKIPDVPPPHYVDQLLMYCVLAKKMKGKIVVFYLTPGRTWKNDVQSTPLLVVWDVEFTPEELVEGEKYAFRIAKQMAESKTNVDLPLCSDWMCGSKQKTGIKINCPYYEDCKPEGRYPKEMLK